MTAVEAYDSATATDFARLSEYLQEQGFKSELRIQLTTDERYQPFPSRSIEADVLGVRVHVPCLEDITRGKLLAYSDPRRRLSKRMNWI